MCTNPLVRFRFKYEPKSDSPISFFDNVFVKKFYAVLYRKRKHHDKNGFVLKSKKKLESLFDSHGHYLSFMDSYCDYMEIPCGRCPECRKSYSRDWSVRCYHESLCHDSNCFITLTIDNLANQMFMDSISNKNTYCKYCINGSRYFRYPIDYSLNKGLIYMWLKKFRDYLYRTYGINIRYFGAGEYGEKEGRPHYHILIFGYNFPNVYDDNGCLKFRTFKANKSHKGVDMFISEELTKLWPYGYSYVEELNHNACSYVAQYCMKKVKSFDKDDYYDYYYGKIPEFLFMSKGNCQVNRCKFVDEIISKRFNSLRNLYIPYCNNCDKTRGGLGYNWLMKYIFDVKNLGYIVIDGKKYPIPDYYKKIIKLTDEKLYDTIHSDNIYYVNEQLLSNPDKNSTKSNDIRNEIVKSRLKYNVRDVV